jgi:ATP-dependent DNA ligase
VTDGEAIVVNEDGLSIFDILRYRLRDDAAVLCAFDLLELDGADFRSHPLEQRKATLAELLYNVCGWRAGRDPCRAGQGCGSRHA